MLISVACIRGPAALSPVGKFSAKLAIFSAHFGICQHILAFGDVFPFFIGIYPFLVGEFKVQPPLQHGLWLISLDYLVGIMNVGRG